MTRSMPSFPAWWERFWLAPAAPFALAAARIIFAVYALWILLSRDFPGVAGFPAYFWGAVAQPERWRFLIFPGHPVVESLLEGVAVAALIAVVIGWRPRTAALVSALLLYHLAPYEGLLWTPSSYFRGLELPILGLGILAAAPCGDAWGIATRRAPSLPGPSWEYRWPLVLLQILVAQPYLFAGYAKLYYTGLRWASWENIRNHLLAFTQDDFFTVHTRFGHWLATHPVLCGAIGAGTLTFELSFMLSVFFPRLRRFYVPAALAFHAGILASMNVYWLYWPLLAVFVNWDVVRQWVIRRWRRAAPRATAEPQLSRT